MRIMVYTGSQEISRQKLIDLAHEDKKQYDLISSEYIEFPESVISTTHPQAIFDGIYKQVRENINNGVNTYIVTWSDIVFYAVRLAIKEAIASGVPAGVYDLKCQCMQYSIDDFKEVQCSVGDIDSRGGVSFWAKGCFDVTDKALYKLID